MKRTFLVLGLLLFGAVGSALGQTLTIRVLDGKSGKPFGNQEVFIGWGGTHYQFDHVRLDKTGAAEVQIPATAASLRVSFGDRIGKPSFQQAYFDCAGHSSFLVRNVLAQGVVAENHCGKGSEKTRPGILVYWAQPLGILRWILPIC